MLKLFLRHNHCVNQTRALNKNFKKSPHTSSEISYQTEAGQLTAHLKKKAGKFKIQSKLKIDFFFFCRLARHWNTCTHLSVSSSVRSSWTAFKMCVVLPGNWLDLWPWYGSVHAVVSSIVVGVRRRQFVSWHLTIMESVYSTSSSVLNCFRQTKFHLEDAESSRSKTSLLKILDSEGSNFSILFSSIFATLQF